MSSTLNVRVIHIAAEDSPNVKYALAQIAQGIEPTNEKLIDGVLEYSEYKYRRATWDRVRQCIGLDGHPYKGAEVLLFPPMWLTRAAMVHRSLAGKPRRAEAIGIDPAEGGDKTAMAAVDRLGLIELVSKKTPNTALITTEAIAFGRKHGVEPDRWVFDRGGGGKQHADRLRDQGFPCRTVAFGEPLALEPKRGLTLIEERKENKEERYVYMDRRTEMYHILSQLLDEVETPGGWGISDREVDLRQQLAPIPKLLDDKGRYWLPSKGTKTEQMKKSNIKTLIDIIGHSPDEADAVVMACWRMLYAPMRAKAGAAL